MVVPSQSNFGNLILYRSTFNELKDVVIVEADGRGLLLLLAARQIALTLGLVENRKDLN